MPEIQKIEIEAKEETPTQPTLPETQTQMAIAFGQMTETNRQLMAEIQADKVERSNLAMTMQAALSEIQALRSQADSTIRHVEQLNESQSAIMSEVITNSENEDKNVIPVTPMETHVQIDQVPINTKKTFLQRILFG